MITIRGDDIAGMTCAREPRMSQFACMSMRLAPALYRSVDRKTVSLIGFTPGRCRRKRSCSDPDVFKLEPFTWHFQHGDLRLTERTKQERYVIQTAHGETLERIGVLVDCRSEFVSA